MDRAALPLPALPGQRLARGAARLLCGLNHAVLAEFVPARGLRVDLISVGPQSEIWIIECKSCRADFQSDRKWQGYLDWCDRYFWAVDTGFPLAMLPEESGVIIADPYGAEIARMAPQTRLAAPRRHRLLRDIARVASLRLQAVTDPSFVSGEVP